jgi:hypothetical protein
LIKIQPKETQEKTPAASTSIPITEVVIIGDNMAKGISERLPHDSIGYCMGGAKATTIKQTLSQIHEPRKYTVLQCGTNNLNEELRFSIPALGSLLDKAQSSTDSPILINAIPSHLTNEKHNDFSTAPEYILEAQVQ